MQVFFWLALGFLIVAIVGGLAYVGVQAWRAWLAFTSFAAGGAAGMEALAERVARTTVKADRVTQKLDELQRAIARLERSTARGRVLVDAMGEALAVVRSVLAFVPKT